MTRTEFNPAKLGVFLIGGLALAVAAFLFWGPVSDLWQRKYLIFFDETATGLDPGSVVRLNGVTIGKVDSIDLFWDPAQTNRVYTAVVVQLDPAKVKRISKNGQSFDTLLGNKEISGHLGLSGLVSLTLEVDLKVEEGPLRTNDYHPWVQSNYSVYFGKHDWIPARQSTIAKVMEKLDDVLNNEGLANLIGSVGSLMATNNTNGLISKTTSALDNFNILSTTLNKTLVSNTNDLRVAVRNFAALSANAGPKLDTLVSNLDDAAVSARVNLDKFGAGVDFITNSLPSLLTNLDALSAQLGVVLRGAAPIPPQALDTLRSLQDTSDSLRRLIDFVERHPDSLLRGRAQEK